MPKRYTYTVTCIKETPVKWGVELESLGDAIPRKIVQMPHLTKSLTQSPYFQLGYNPMTYFKLLLKGMPDMLRGYNTRILKRINDRLNQLQVGECCYVKVSYIDSGEDVSPYNYDIQLMKEPLLESRHIANRDELPPLDVLDKNKRGVPRGGATDLNRQGLPQSTTGGQVDVITRIAQLHEEIKKLQADMNLIKEWLAAGYHGSQKIQSEEAITTTATQAAAVEPTVTHRESKPRHASLAEESEPQKKSGIMLNQDESIAIQCVMNQQVVTESQLRDEYSIDKPTEVMVSLIDKMDQYNSPWIDVQKDENGELVYLWTRPDEV